MFGFNSTVVEISDQDLKNEFDQKNVLFSA